MKTPNAINYIPIFIIFILIPRVVLAHHPLEGDMPLTVVNGLLSGLGHPLMDAFHLIFLVGLAIFLGLSNQSARQSIFSLLVCLLATAAGTLFIQATGIQITATNLSALIALTLLVLATFIGFNVYTIFSVSTFIIFGGIIHGLAFSETVIGAEPTPILAYIAGLILMHCAVLTTVLLISRKVLSSRSSLRTLASRFTASGLFTAGMIGLLAG